MSALTASLRTFAKVFSHEASVAVRSPGRVNLIGEHVDYQQGLVMPFAVDRYIHGIAAAITEPEVRLWSSSMGGAPLHFSLDALRPQDRPNGWANYVLGVVDAYARDNVASGGFELFIDGDLPIGAGLSSSAALESITALVIEYLSGIERSPTDRAKLCQAAEHQFAGVPCGLMDQLAVNHGRAGHALMIDCRSEEITPVPLPNELVYVMVNSGVRHALADGEYAKRKSDVETASEKLGVTSLRDATLTAVQDERDSLGEQLFQRARHIVTENARVERFATALTHGDHMALGELMTASHVSLRDDYQVSCVELDILAELASELGAVGSRMTGGGFGGCTINLVPRERAENFCQDICQAYHDRKGKSVEAFTVEPVDGANLLWNAEEDSLRTAS